MPCYLFQDAQQPQSECFEIDIDESTSKTRFLYELHLKHAEGGGCLYLNSKAVSDDFRSLLQDGEVNLITFALDDLFLDSLKADLRRELTQMDTDVTDMSIEQLKQRIVMTQLQIKEVAQKQELAKQELELAKHQLEVQKLANITASLKIAEEKAITEAEKEKATRAGQVQRVKRIAEESCDSCGYPYDDEDPLSVFDSNDDEASSFDDVDGGQL